MLSALTHKPYLNPLHYMRINNIFVIISSNKVTIVSLLKLIETKFHHIFDLAPGCKFEELQDIIVKEIRLKIIIDSFGYI